MTSSAQRNHVTIATVYLMTYLATFTMMTTVKAEFQKGQIKNNNKNIMAKKFIAVYRKLL